MYKPLSIGHRLFILHVWLVGTLYNKGNFEKNKASLKKSSFASGCLKF
jgi:hypothetical protein